MESTDVRIPSSQKALHTSDLLTNFVCSYFYFNWVLFTVSVGLFLVICNC